MELKFNFNNGTPPVAYNKTTNRATPLELLVSATGTPASQRQAMAYYIKTIDYTFRGVSNAVSGKIANFEVEKAWFGKIKKDMSTVKWASITDKTFIVIYDLAILELNEHMYVADAIETMNKGEKETVKPVWIDELLDPKPTIMRENIISAISIITEFSPKYKIAWGFNGVEALTVLDQNNKVLDVDDVEDDEIFILIRLMTLLINKGTHLGVFLLDCTNFSDRVLEGITQAAKDFFGDTFIFFYNVPKNSTVFRDQLELPNFLA